MMRHDRNEPTNVNPDAVVQRLDSLIAERDELRAEVDEWARRWHDMKAQRDRRPAEIDLLAAEAERNHAEAEVKRLRAEIRDRESERADLRDRVQKAEAALADPWSLKGNVVALEGGGAMSGRGRLDRYAEAIRTPGEGRVYAVVALADAEIKRAEAKVARVEGLHFRRPWDFLRDSVTFGQTQYPDLCDHCRSNWPCPTLAALKGES